MEDADMLSVSFLTPRVSIDQHRQREDRPTRTSENSSWIGSLVSSRHKLQQASLSLAILMDGELSVVGGHSLCREAARCNLGSPVASTSLADSIFFGWSLLSTS